MKVVFISDIHGIYKYLELLEEKNLIKDCDYFIVLGDIFGPVESNNLKIKQTSGGAYLNNLKINDLDINNTSGNVSLNNIETNSISINTTSSSILLKKVKANSLLIKGVSSAVKTTKSIIHNNIDIETYSGIIELYLNENIEGFKLKASSNSTIKNEFNDFNYKNESLDINLKSISGLINVLKEV